MGVTLGEMIEDLNANGEDVFYKYEVMDFGMNAKSADFYASQLSKAVHKVEHIAIMGADKFVIDNETGEHRRIKRLILSNEPEQVKIELSKLMVDKEALHELSDFAQDELIHDN